MTILEIAVQLYHLKKKRSIKKVTETSEIILFSKKKTRLIIERFELIELFLRLVYMHRNYA